MHAETLRVTAAPIGQTLFRVEDLVKAEPSLSVGGIRHDLFNRKTNGLEESGAVVYRGRRLLLHRERYLTWMVGRSRKGA